MTTDAAVASPALLRAFGHCERCRRRSTWIAGFSRTRSFGEPSMLCPPCANRRRTRGVYWTWAGAAAVLTLIPLAVWAGWLSRPLWFAMGWGGFVLAQQLSLLPHELGHALMAKAVGYRPIAIVFGGITPLIDTRIFGIRTLIGPAPEDGMAAFEPMGRHWPRLKDALITLAGPMANLLLAGLAFSGLAWLGESPKSSIPSFVLLVFGIANAWLGLGNLWPTKLSTALGPMSSDGGRLLSIWRESSPDPAVQRADARMLRAWFEFRDAEYEQVLATLEEIVDIKGLSLPLEVTRSAALCNLDRPHEAGERLLAALALPDQPATPDFEAMAQNNLAWASLMIDDPADESDRLARSAHAIEVLPWLLPVVVTRVCVLASAGDPARGQLDEARDLLSRMHDLETPKASKAAMPLMLGLVAAAEGDFATARKRLDEYRSTDNPGMVARVLEARIPSR